MMTKTKRCRVGQDGYDFALWRSVVVINKKMVMMEMTMMIVIKMMALAQIPISTFSHIWVFVRQYGIMFVIIVIIIIIIIIIYRKVKVSTLKHV